MIMKMEDDDAVVVTVVVVVVIIINEGNIKINRINRSDNDT